jgi:GntR family transcriptional regulator
MFSGYEAMRLNFAAHRRGRRPAGQSKLNEALLRLPSPLYVQLVTLFQRRVESGEWEVGSQVPTLDQLQKELGVARATIRHAIGFLEQEGLIGRYRGRGTFVLRKPEIDVWHDIPSNWDDLVRADTNTKMEWLENRRAKDFAPFHEGGTMASTYQYVRRLHRRNGVPYLIGMAYIEDELFKSLGRAGLQHAAPLKALEEIGVGRAEQTIQIGTADLEAAQLLEVSLNSPTVIVMRSVFDRDGLLRYQSEGTHRGDFVRIRTRLK